MCEPGCISVDNLGLGRRKCPWDLGSSGCSQREGKDMKAGLMSSTVFYAALQPVGMGECDWRQTDPSGRHSMDGPQSALSK